MHLKPPSQWVKEANERHKQEQSKSLLEFCHNSPTFPILWPVSMFAIRKEARKSSFLSLKFTCPKHPLRAGPRPKELWPGLQTPCEQVSHHGGTGDTCLRQTGTVVSVSNLPICYCSITKPVSSKSGGKSGDDWAKASHTKWLTYILPVLLRMCSSPHILGNCQKRLFQILKRTRLKHISAKPAYRTDPWLSTGVFSLASAGRLSGQS